MPDSEGAAPVKPCPFACGGNIRWQGIQSPAPDPSGMIEHFSGSFDCPAEGGHHITDWNRRASPAQEGLEAGWIEQMCVKHSNQWMDLQGLLEMYARGEYTVTMVAEWLKERAKASTRTELMNAQDAGEPVTLASLPRFDFSPPFEAQEREYAAQMCDAPEGEFVRYDDVLQLVIASPKLAPQDAGAAAEMLSEQQEDEIILAGFEAVVASGDYPCFDVPDERGPEWESERTALRAMLKKFRSLPTPEQTETPPSEIGWLLTFHVDREIDGVRRPTWAKAIRCVTNSTYERLTQHHEFTMTHDANEALRFSRKQDAEAALAIVDIPYSGLVKVEEHMWPLPPAEPTSQEPVTEAMVERAARAIAKSRGHAADEFDQRSIVRQEFTQDAFIAITAALHRPPVEQGSTEKP